MESYCQSLEAWRPEDEEGDDERCNFVGIGEEWRDDGEYKKCREVEMEKEGE